MKRPTSVTIIAWILIVSSAISLISNSMSMDNPMVREIMEMNPLPISLQLFMLYFGLTIGLVTGIAMLKGQNWARMLFIGWSMIGIVVGFLTSPMKMALIPGLVIFSIEAYFLFRPIANQYFSTKEVEESAQTI